MKLLKHLPLCFGIVVSIAGFVISILTDTTEAVPAIDNYLTKEFEFESSNIKYKSNYRIENNPYLEESIFYTTHTIVEESTEITTVTPSVVNKRLISQNKLEQLDKEAKDLIGTPYVWGGTTPYKGMDCSGYTQFVMKQLGINNIPRVSKDQSKYGILVPRTSLRKGDLLFFDTTNPRDANDIKTPTQELQYAKQVEEGYKPTNVSHVGIYMGDGVMLHASSGDGIITYADLNSPYYKNRFLHARRVIK